MRARILGAAVLAVSIGMVARAEEKPLDRLALDQRVVTAAYEVALLGTDLFNKGNQEGCFRLYQGSLLAFLPLLDHRPKLAAAVKDKLDKARGMEAAKGAFVLREALDEIQHVIAPNPKAEPKKPVTLWDRLGGEPGVTKIVDQVFALAIEEPRVDLLRGGKFKLDEKGVAHFKKMLVEFISAGTGGPLKYTGKSMKEAHAGMKITDAEFDALASLLVGALKTNKVAEADIKDLLEIVGATRKDIVEGKN